MRRTIRIMVCLSALALTLPGYAQPGQPQGTPTSQKVIKDPAEYNAYVTALNTSDPAQKATAMEAFIAEYPASIVKIDALEQAMAAYQQLNNADKVEATARRILQLEPSHIRALAMITYIERVAATGGNKQALAAATADAQKGLQALPGWQRPDGFTDADFEKLRNQMAAIFNGAAGFGALNARDYSAARSYYLKAVHLDPASLQDTYQLSVAELEINPLDVNGFWHIARALSLAQGNPAAQKSFTDYGRAKYKRFHGSEDGWEQIVAAAANQAEPPADFSRSIKPAPTAAEIAVQAVKENDPGTLSFGDWEFILALRDASPANGQAAETVWQAIRAKEEQGAAKLELKVKVISATREVIEAAITDENQVAKRADLKITMAKPLLHAPLPGSSIRVIGVLTDFTPQPFLFLMEQGALAGPSKPPTPATSPSR